MKGVLVTEARSPCLARFLPMYLCLERSRYTSEDLRILVETLRTNLGTTLEVHHHFQSSSNLLSEDLVTSVFKTLLDLLDRLPRAKSCI